MFRTAAAILDRCPHGENSYGCRRGSKVTIESPALKPLVKYDILTMFPDLAEGKTSHIICRRIWLRR